MAESKKDYGTGTEESKVAKADLEKAQTEEVFPYTSHHGLTTEEALRILEIEGYNEIPEKSVPGWYIFLMLLIQPMPLMIWLAIIIEAAIGNYIDMAILLFIQFANAGIAFYETTKAEDAVKALKKDLVSDAFVVRDGVEKKIPARELVPGDLVSLCSGKHIQADCIVNPVEDVSTTIEVDESGLTGESIWATKYGGSKCYMGTTTQRGEMHATVTCTGMKTYFGKTAALLQGEPETSNLQNILIDIMIVLVLLSLALCSIVFVYLIQSIDILDALSFTVVLLVASIPLAIEIVTTTTLALGSKEMSKHKAIVTRLSAIEDMAGMSILCSDKTGTLTLNKMVIQEKFYKPYGKGGLKNSDKHSHYDVLRYAAMAAKWLEEPKDALDTLVLNAFDRDSMKDVVQLNYMPFDPVNKRTEGTVTEKGVTLTTCKGAPHILLTKLFAGQTDLHEQVDSDVTELGEQGIRALAVAIKKGDKLSTEPWEMCGLLAFSDPPRPDTAQTIIDARNYGVMVKMITGDHLLIAKQTSKDLNMGTNIFIGTDLPLLDEQTKEKPDDLVEKYGDLCLGADGFAGVFPEHKYLIVECLRDMGYKVGMTGDGVNDAPALKRADVGIAVKGCTDAARSAASMCLGEDGLSTIIDGIKMARCVFLRIRNFILYRISATLQLLIFFFIAVFAFKPSEYQPDPNPDTEDWPTFFHMPVIMLMLITLLNDGTLIAIGYDNVNPSKDPEVWNLRVLFFIGSVLGGVACISSLLLLWMLLDSWNANGVFQFVGLPGLSYGQITTSIYLKVSISDFLTLFSSRTGDDWFWTSAPAPILLAAAALALSLSTILGCLWPESYPDGVYTIGLAYKEPYMLPVYIWLYCIAWWFIQDACKVASFYYLRNFGGPDGVFEINKTGKILELPEKTQTYIKERAEEDAKKPKKGGHH